MARIRLSRCSGTQPFCQAKPSTMGFTYKVSPIKVLAAPSKSSVARPSSPTALASSCSQALSGFFQSALRTKPAVGEPCAFSAMCVRPSRRRARVSSCTATMGSQASTRSAAAVRTRVVWMSACAGAISTWLQVAPPFCASPAASCVTMPLPSMCAATPSSWPMVITPVPPTPATTMPQGSAPGCSVGKFGSSMAPSAAGVRSFLGAVCLRSCPPSTVTKLGQKPFRQLKSLLQLLWLMLRLRPNSVSSGSTDRQLLCTPQSPQPSHTSSLMTTRLAGSTILPRLRRRRFSVAQVWSYKMMVTPGSSRSSRWIASKSSRWRMDTGFPS